MFKNNSPRRLSVWAVKPWWCQPWSIALTGFGLIGGSWFLLHRWWVTVLLGCPVLAWMIYFLLVYPQLFLQAQKPDGLTGENPASAIANLPLE